MYLKVNKKTLLAKEKLVKRNRWREGEREGGGGREGMREEGWSMTS